MQYPTATVNDNENYKLLLKLNNDKYKDILNNLLQTATEYNIKLEQKEEFAMKENEKTNTQNNNINSGDKLGYLQLIQEPICRMSTISAIFKGFAAAIVGGIAMISFKYINLIVLGLSFLPVFAFAMLDIYYLKLEKKFRYLYIKTYLNF